MPAANMESFLSVSRGAKKIFYRHKKLQYRAAAGGKINLCREQAGQQAFPTNLNLTSRRP
jgi:hypothetical protein